MYTNIKDVVKFVEVVLENSSAVYFNREDYGFYTSDQKVREAKFCDSHEIESCKEQYIQLPCVKMEELIDSYLEYANDINLKRKYINSINTQKADGVSCVNYKACFESVVAEENLELDWNDFKYADLEKVADKWCKRNKIDFRFSQICA